MEYELYHDESMEQGFWHGMLLVPTATKTQLVELLERARSSTRYTDPLGVKGVNRPSRRSDCAEAWCSIGVLCLARLGCHAPLPTYLGAKTRGERVYTLERTRIGAKFILFRERSSHRDMDGYPDHASKVETTLRMGLKGGLHLLGSADSEVIVSHLHFDGWEHHKRRVDPSRIVGRLVGLRAYCAVSDNLDDRSGNHSKSDHQDYDDCQLLQLCDVFIGAFRSALGVRTNAYQRVLAQYAKPLIERYQDGPARMRNSAWRGGFCLSECELVDGQWRFAQLVPADQAGVQRRLFGDSGSEEGHGLECP